MHVMPSGKKCRAKLNKAQAFLYACRSDAQNSVARSAYAAAAIEAGM
jgi:hypothetical protein